MSKHKINPDACTACTTCVVHCPVAAASRQFGGPKMAGPALERFRVSGGSTDSMIEYCSNCKNCEITCPSGVPVSTLNMLAKAKYYKTHKHSLRDWLLSHGENMAKLASPMPLLSNLGMANLLTKFIMGRIGIAEKRQLPAYASRTFVSQFKEYRQTERPKKVVFFPGCFINYNAPEIGMQLVKILEANKYEVIVPDHLECCGSPLVVNGYLDEARSKAENNIIELKRWTDKGYPVLTACTSCGLMLRQEYQELFDIYGQPEVAANIYDACEFLLELDQKGELNKNFAPQSGKYLYHAPCHLRVQGIGLPGLELIEMLPGIKVEEADAGCCGMSGSYGFKADKYEISMEIGKQLFNKIARTNPDAVVSECGTCRLQIGHGTGKASVHPISLLYKAYFKA